MPENVAFTQPGDAVLAEAVDYPGLRSAARRLGRRVVDIEAGDEGMRPDALERAGREHGARLVYLDPTIRNPTTRTMPGSRRRAILRCGGRLDMRLVEDDPYWLLAERAPPPLARLAPDRVHSVASLSKCLSPGLCTAFVSAPDFAREARTQGLAATPGGAFASGPGAPNATRISLGEGRDRARLAAALKKLSGLLAQAPAGRGEPLI